MFTRPSEVIGNQVTRGRNIYFSLFSRHIEKPLDPQFLIVLQKLVCGAWECRFSPNRKKPYAIARHRTGLQDDDSYTRKRNFPFLFSSALTIMKRSGQVAICAENEWQSFRSKNDRKLELKSTYKGCMFGRQ
jgi:hypothetical protein